MASCTHLGCSHLDRNHKWMLGTSNTHLRSIQLLPTHPHCPDRLLSLESSGAPLFWNTLGQESLWTKCSLQCPCPSMAQAQHEGAKSLSCLQEPQPSLKEQLSILSSNSSTCSSPNDSKSVQFSLLSSECSPDQAPQSCHCLSITLSQSPNSLQWLCLRMQRQSLLYIQHSIYFGFFLLPSSFTQIALSQH